MRITPLLALLALVVPVAGAGLACSDSGDERLAETLHNILIAGTENPDSFESFPGRLPPDLPEQPPLYPGAKLIMSSRQLALPDDVTDTQDDTRRSAVYFILLETEDPASEVFSYYERELDEGGWQLEGTGSTEELQKLLFTLVEDLDITGAVSIARRTGGERTTVLITLGDAGAELVEEADFELGESLTPPAAFPSDVPLYEGGVIVETGFSRLPGSETLFITFLTRDSQDDVIAFYEDALAGNGWSVEDGQAMGLADSIDFSDGTGELEGVVIADRSPRDRSYTEVTLVVNQSSSREPAEPDETQDAPSPTPDAADGSPAPS